MKKRRCRSTLDTREGLPTACVSEVVKRYEGLRRRARATALSGKTQNTGKYTPYTRERDATEDRWMVIDRDCTRCAAISGVQLYNEA